MPETLRSLPSLDNMWSHSHFSWVNSLSANDDLLDACWEQWLSSGAPCMPSVMWRFRTDSIVPRCTTTAWCRSRRQVR